MGFQMDPIVILAISIAITLKSCFMLHVKIIKTEKQFVSFTSTILILSWGIFSSIKRICSMVSFFIPSMGLFSILYHHRAEQVPFSIWQKYGKIQTDKIVLYGLEETVLWILTDGIIPMILMDNLLTTQRTQEQALEQHSSSSSF